MKKLQLFVGVLFLLSACSSGTSVTLRPVPTGTRTALSPIETATATIMPSPTSTDVPTPTMTASPIPTATWIVQGPGDVTVPILLFHRIDVSPIDSRYYVPPELFDQELQVLEDWDYTTITTTMLVQAIVMGRELPPHPILITFDDGHLDNYKNAFPIMKKHGFTGVLYIVGNYIGADGYLDKDEILEMHAAGWEIGSHSMRHLDLTTLGPDDQRREIVGSREKLESVLGIDILTFAYPFGAKNSSTMDYVRFAGYIAAMGAEGYTDSQGEWNLYNLQRVEIKGSETAKTFTRFLSWHSPIE